MDLMPLRHDEREREAGAYGNQQDAQHERHNHRLLEYAVQKRHLGNRTTSTAQDERNYNASRYSLVHEDARDWNHRFHADVHGDANDGSKRYRPEIVSTGEVLKELGRYEPVDECTYARAEKQPANNPLEQSDGVF